MEENSNTRRIFRRWEERKQRVPKIFSATNVKYNIPIREQKETVMEGARQLRILYEKLLEIDELLYKENQKRGNNGAIFRNQISNISPLYTENHVLFADATRICLENQMNCNSVECRAYMSYGLRIRHMMEYYLMFENTMSPDNAQDLINKFRQAPGINSSKINKNINANTE